MSDAPTRPVIPARLLVRHRFDEWDLEPAVLDALADRGWERPTLVQYETIPLARQGHDLLGQARTGSGKTAAFGLPAIERAMPGSGVQVLILTPTRELAVQVAEELDWLQGVKGLSLVTVYGGDSLERQAKALEEGADMVVGTPGRVMDMARRGHLDLATPGLLVLDEADRMLDMGFFPDVEWILEQMTSRAQTLLFSATFPMEIIDTAQTFMREPEHLMAHGMTVEVPSIDQAWIEVGRANKLWAVGRLLARHATQAGQALVFCNTKRMVDLLVERLAKHRFDAVALHGDLPQKQRERILKRFKDGEVDLVIATDVAARGLDVDGVTLVINYDLSDDLENYVHRIGRTGRMGRAGEAWSLVGRDEIGLLHRIEATFALTIPEQEAPELPEGVHRDPVRRRQDWDEAADVFGFVPLALSIGTRDGASHHSLTEWVRKETRLPELAVGEVTVGERSSTVRLHVSKASLAIDVLRARSWCGADVVVEPSQA